MRILLDTNVLLDYFQHREGFTTSEKILQACADNSISGFVAAHSFPNMFYILRKFYSDEERREILTNIISLLNVAEISHPLIASALSRKDFHDFEDCLQDECAAMVGADYIVTSNIKDFEKSKIKAILPEDFLQRLSI